MDWSGDSLDRLAEHLASARRAVARGLSERIQLEVLRDEATRIVDRMDGLAAGELRYSEFVDAWSIVQTVRASAAIRQVQCTLRCHELRKAGNPLANRVAAALCTWVTQTPRRTQRSITLLWKAELDAIRDPEFLDVALLARRAGWRVSAGTDNSEIGAMTMRLRTAEGDIVTLALHGDPGSDERVWAVGMKAAVGDVTNETPPAAASLHELLLPSPLERHPAVTEEAKIADPRRSIMDIFGHHIALRDLEPRDSYLPGLGTLRKDLGWDPGYIPRKNEPEYGQVLTRITHGLRPGGPDQIVFVGDTLLNDGGAILGLQEAASHSQEVWGFLCGAAPLSLKADFVLNRIYFAATWTGLSAFFKYAIDDGLRLSPSTVVLFDLDQTVYAAKARDDAPLHLARWEAMRDYLVDLVPAYKFDGERAEAMYREFDSDRYHPVTRDNLDYVVLLVLAVASGLSDAAEIRRYATSARPSIGALAEELHRRACVRVGHEDIGETLSAIKEIYYNTIAGDQTPCKRFRRAECLAMARRMGADGDDAIALNREVTDAIAFLKRRGVTVMAFSDRPVEAALIEEDDPLQRIDIMHVEMTTRGSSISLDLEHVAS